jgi:hypothetical protein
LIPREQRHGMTKCCGAVERIWNVPNNIRIT